VIAAAFAAARAPAFLILPSRRSASSAIRARLSARIRWNSGSGICRCGARLREVLVNAGLIERRRLIVGFLKPRNRPNTRASRPIRCAGGVRLADAHEVGQARRLRGCAEPPECPFPPPYSSDTNGKIGRSAARGRAA
jgi:hypothetical protein